jgi:hypothetical protein
MNPLTVLTLASAAMQLIKESMPVLRDAIKGGEISEEDQARVFAEYTELRALAGEKYTGPEWELSGR